MSAWLVLRATLAAAALPGTVTIVVPWVLLRWGSARFLLGPARWLALAPLAVAVGGLLWCIVDFARLGRGTLAVVDPPRFLVRGGLYQRVRNPMYLCVLTVLASEAILFGALAIACWALVMTAGFHLFVVLYEEPTMCRRFGADYEEYLRTVPRWIPRRPRAG